MPGAAVLTLWLLAQTTGPVAGDTREPYDDGRRCFEELNYSCARASFELALTRAGKAGAAATRVELLTWLGATLAYAGQAGEAEDAFYDALVAGDGAELDLKRFDFSPRLTAIVDRARKRAQATLKARRRAAAESELPRRWTLTLGAGVPVLLDREAQLFQLGGAGEFAGGYALTRWFAVRAALTGLFAGVDTSASDSVHGTPRSGRLKLAAFTAGARFRVPAADWLQFAGGAEFGYAAFAVAGSARGPALRVPIEAAIFPAAGPWGFGLLVAPSIVFAGTRFATDVPILAAVDFAF